MVFAFMQNINATEPLSTYPGVVVSSNYGVSNLSVVPSVISTCPAAPMYELICQDGYHVEIQYDENGCEIGQICVADSTCPPVPMSQLICEDGYHVELQYDANGCVIGQVCVIDSTCSSTTMDDLAKEINENNNLIRELIDLLKQIFSL